MVGGGQGGLPERGEVCTANGSNIENIVGEFYLPSVPPRSSAGMTQLTTVVILVSDPHLGFLGWHHAHKSRFVFFNVAYDFKMFY